MTTVIAMFVVAASVAIVGSLPTVSAQSADRKVVIAEKFVLIDREGSKRAELATTVTGAVFALYDNDGECSIRLSASPDHPYAQIGKRGQVAMLQVKSGDARLSLETSGGKAAVELVAGTEMGWIDLSNFRQEANSYISPRGIMYFEKGNRTKNIP